MQVSDRRRLHSCGFWLRASLQGWSCVFPVACWCHIPAENKPSVFPVDGSASAPICSCNHTRTDKNSHWPHLCPPVEVIHNIAIMSAGCPPLQISPFHSSKFQYEGKSPVWVKCFTFAFQNSIFKLWDLEPQQLLFVTSRKKDVYSAWEALKDEEVRNKQTCWGRRKHVSCVLRVRQKQYQMNTIVCWWSCRRFLIHLTGSLYMQAHKNAAEVVSYSRSLNRPQSCQRKWSRLHRREPTQHHLWLKPSTTVCVCMCASLCICHSLYWGMEGHPCMSLMCACASAWEATAWLLVLTLARWQCKCSAVSMTGSHTPLAPLRRANINNSKWSRLLLRLLPVALGWADIAAAWKATNRQKAEEEKLWCAAKRHPRGSCYQLSCGDRIILLRESKSPLCVHIESHVY